MKFRTFILFFGCLLVLEKVCANAPKQVVVGPDDTVYGIAYNHGIPTRALIAANNLKPPYNLTKGQVLIIPAPNEHLVGAGESLQSIAEDYGVNVDVLAQENNLESPTILAPGEKISIPSRDTTTLNEALKPPSQEIKTSSLAPLPLVKSAPKSNKSDAHTIVPTEADSTSRPKPLPSDLAEEIAREKNAKDTTKGTEDTLDKPRLMGNLAQGNAGTPITPPESSQVEQKEEKKPKKVVKKEEKKETKKTEASSKEDLFIWPVEGTVIHKFNAGGKNDGINIKVDEGTPVKASAAGEVMYAGNELKSFGNLLLIKHQDGWMTAYAHNANLLVKKGDKVKKGQTIAKSGKTGDVKEPQLHFEIRKGKQPVDPLSKLES